MSGIFISVIFPLILFALGIFSPDIRRVIIESVEKIRYRNDEKYNNKIDQKIERIRRLQNPVAAIGYFSGQMLLSFVIMTMFLFCAVNLLLKANIWPSVIGFLVFWYWLLIYTSMQVDVAFQVSHGETAIERLQSRKRL